MNELGRRAIRLASGWKLLQSFAIVKRIIHAVLGLVFLAALVRARDANTDPIVNPDPLVSAPLAVASGGVTNSQLKFAPLSSNSISFQETKAQAEKGDATAQSNLGFAYLTGQGVTTNFAEAVNWCRKAAEQGEPYAQFNLGCILYYGEGVPQDYAEAVKWYRKGAEWGLAEAQYNLGSCYQNGQGVPQDYAEAVKWYRKAAEQGNANAQYNLGCCYDNGEGVFKNDAVAIKWWRKAAEQGMATAQYNLGLCYHNGEGMSKNDAEAVKWWRKASEQGMAAAQYNLGLCYHNGEGVSKNDGEAVEWYRKAAEQANTGAQIALGVAYFTGVGVTTNFAEAVKLFRKPAEQGDSWAQYSLGIAYDGGYGVTQDHAEAAKWLRRAAQQGDATAQCQLGRMYALGQGVPEDYVEAYKWFNLAAAQNVADGIHLRDGLSATSFITPAQIAEAQRLSREFVARKEGTASSQADGQDSVSAGNMPRFSGTGFFVTDDGYLLTAFHVVADAARIVIRTKAGTFAATLVKADKANDVALLKMTGKFPALPVASSRRVRLGESVFTIGFPNIELQGFAPKLTKGEISSLTGMQDDPREFQISVPVQPGNSGGPLVNQNGSVVGIVEAQLADMATLQTTGSLPQNVNYAMKSSVLNVLLESLPEVSAKLIEPNPIKDRKFEDVEKEAESAAALVLVY
jgi:hypothetical protein